VIVRQSLSGSEATDTEQLRRVAMALVAEARSEGRTALTEREGRALLEAIGVPVPSARMVASSERKALTEALYSLGQTVPGGLSGRAVVKVVSAAILHKTEAGGVALIRGSEEDLEDSVFAAIGNMERRFQGLPVSGYMIAEFVPYGGEFGRELILGYRVTPDFGPLVTVAAGGVRAEFMAHRIRDDRSLAVLSPALAERALDLRYAARALPRSFAVEAATASIRGTAPMVDLNLLASVVAALLEAAPILAEAGIEEFEANPLVVTGEGDAARLVALDALAKITVEGTALPECAPPRPIEKIGCLLKPRRIGIVGVSEKLNKGRIILRNILKDGTAPESVYIIKPGAKEIDGCRCVDDVASLPEQVDLLILAIPAASVPALVAEASRTEKAQSIIVIPGGLEEKAGTEDIVRSMKDALIQSRGSPWRGPVINGGNCLGVRSVEGAYNTLFIPSYKLPMPEGDTAPLAMVTQSGAFAIERLSRMRRLNPRYVVTIGNQTDLTVGDYLSYLADDPSIRVFAVYVEGFKPLDGVSFLRAARRIIDSGRTVILYRSGRTNAGAKASASHTASIAGDYAVTRILAEDAGIQVAEGFDDFDDLMKIFTLLEGRKARGLSLGAVSNAGCECVAIADNLGAFNLASLSEETNGRLATMLGKAGIDSIVDIHNPADITPMADDEAYEGVFRTILEDDAVHVGVVGLVPFANTVTSLPRNPSVHGEDIEAVYSLPSRFGRLMAETSKPWVAIVDAGSLYDPMVEALEGLKVPTYRSVGRALRALNAFVRAGANRA